MKRISMVVAMAAAVGIAFSAAPAVAQTWEMHQFFGEGSLVPPVGIPGLSGMDANPVAIAAPGDTVYFPIFLRVVGGDNVFTQVANARWRVYAVPNGGAATASTADQVLVDYAPYTEVETAGDGSTNASGPAGNSQLLGTTGYAGLLGQPAYFRSDGAGLPATYEGTGVYYLGYVGVNVGAAGSPSIDLYFATLGTNGGYSVQSGASNNLAFGWNDDTMAPNSEKLGGGIIAGAGPNQFSTFPDASIIPEPGTMGLLALGLLAIRRRRNN